MTRLRSPFWAALFVFALGVVVWIGNTSSPVQTQELERVLEIERYPDEPLQLIKLRIGTQSVKEHIKQKFKDEKSKFAIDRVKFKEKDDWVKRLSITLRNASDKPIYGLQGLLFFKPVGFSMMFSLQLTHPKQLRHEPLQPGAEIELSVEQKFLNLTLEDAKNHGADLRGAVLSFSLETVIFSDELRWYRGFLVRPDSAQPDRWVPVNDPLAMKRDQPKVDNAAGLFVKASLRSDSTIRFAEPFDPTSMVFSTCTAWSGQSFQGPSCAGDPADCIARTDIDDSINPGLFSHVAFSGVCVDRRELGLVCSQIGNHNRLQIDSNCQVCPDADGDGFQAASCGGQDCNDTPGTGQGAGANIHPNATENCSDGIDNNCNGLTDDQDTCGCPTYEGDLWQPGGTFDCSLCEDAQDNDCDGDTDYADNGCNPNNCASPVLVDVSGNGFDLTNAAKGVNFDVNSDGTKERLSWTVPQTDDAWLALDRNGDGVINNGTELFGNFTPQNTPPVGFGRNGFNALVEYDQAAKGGNGDKLISQQDTIFGQLLLWQDKNHNGISEAHELHSLKQLGLAAIDCDYKESKRRDQHGNLFRYRAKVQNTPNTRISRWAWDVFLVRDPSLLGRYGFDQVEWTPTGSMVEWLHKMAE